MLRKCLVSFLIAVLVLVQPVAMASDTMGGDLAAQGGPRKQVATIIFAGLAGAILGLSTLSFYGRPQDKLSNIAIGFAIGIITGTLYTTYQAATKPKEFYNLNTYETESWAAMEPQTIGPQAYTLGYQWDF